jgi:hypothetical protein
MPISMVNTRAIPAVMDWMIGANLRQSCNSYSARHRERSRPRRFELVSPAVAERGPCIQGGKVSGMDA